MGDEPNIFNVQIELIKNKLKFKREIIAEADLLVIDHNLKGGGSGNRNDFDFNGEDAIKRINKEWELVKDWILYSSKLDFITAANLKRKHNLHAFMSRDEDFDKKAFHFLTWVHKKNYERKLEYTNFITSSKLMKDVDEKIKLVAKKNVPVLIIGETGVGKERVARRIWEKSLRKMENFVSINCAAIPENLIESELFGHVEGAFTGATKTTVGKFKLADGGTIFLDEIGEAPHAVQVKLLRVLQDGIINKVGSIKDDNVNVRLICATNKKLYIKAEREKEKFREDLYYRINTFPIILHPLRDRKDDIRELVDQSIKNCNKNFTINISGIDSQSEEFLKKYDFPGNTRELESIVCRAVILSNKCEGTLEEADFSKAINLDKILSKQSSIEDIHTESDSALTKLLYSDNYDDWAEYFKIVKHFPGKSQMTTKIKLTGLEKEKLEEREKDILTELSKMFDVREIASLTGRKPNQTNQIYEMFKKYGIGNKNIQSIQNNNS